MEEKNIMIRPTQVRVSNINENPIDVVEKLGKYELIYDFSNKSCSGGFAGGFICFGKDFSKGDVIDVVRFETPITFGGTPTRNAIIKINNKEESYIPKEYLSKVDDSTPVTLQTGVNFGQNRRPTQVGVSNIYENPIDALEKLGKYEFIYDYSAINRLLFAVPDMLKQLSSNANTGFYNFDGDGTGLTSPINWEALFPQPVKINPNAQVGVFSKGNIVNVVRFDGNNAIIENVNYKAPDPTIFTEKTVWGELLGGVVNKKELSIPKDYLRKVDDTLNATIFTGINYGANMKPQPFVNYIKPTSQLTTIELNASFVLTRDFKYVLKYEKLEEGIKLGVSIPVFADLKAGTKVMGDLIRKPNNNMYRVMAGYPTPPPYNDFLRVKGVGVDEFIDIPIEYLTRVEPKPYLIIQDFIIYSRWENRMGQSGVQELPYSKGSVMFLPTTTHQDQFDIALKGGKLQELPIVSVVSLVDKQVGKCISDGALYQTMEYNPCRTVKKGEILTGYIANGVFSNTNKDIMKPQLSFGEYKLVQTNSGKVVTVKNDNKNLLMIAGAFLLGYALFRKRDSSN